MTQALQIANNLIEASETLRKLFTDTYDEKSKQVQDAIRQVMEAKGKDVLPATLLLMEAAMKDGHENHIHWFAAAACDMLMGQQPHVSPRTHLRQLADSFKLSEYGIHGY